MEYLNFKWKDLCEISMDIYMKMGREILILMKIGQAFEAFDKKTEVLLWLFLNKFLPKLKKKVLDEAVEKFKINF